MIEVAQGSPGSGKSAVAVARAIMHIKKGGVVAANFALVEGWAEEVAKRHWLVTLLRLLCLGSWADAVANDLAVSMHKRFYVVNSVEAIRKINPLSEAEGVYTDDGSYSEGSGLLLLDECQLVFNSRKWDKNFQWIEFFTQHRKLGWNVILIAHSIEMIDSQIRPLAEYESRFRNLQKVRLPVLGLPLSPYPLFLVIKRYAGLGAGAAVVASRDLFPLPLWAARLYDSLLVFNADSWGSDTDPMRCGAAPAPLCGVGVVPPPPRSSCLVGPHWDEYLMSIGEKTVS